ncbi:hypothetical protein ACQ4PT_063405 [Festuca glaucescens]
MALQRQIIAMLYLMAVRIPAPISRVLFVSFVSLGFLAEGESPSRVSAPLPAPIHPEPLTTMDLDEYDYLEKAVEPPVPSTSGAGEKDRSSRRRSSAGGGRDLEERGSKRPRSGEDRERHRSGRDREDGKEKVWEGRDREKVRDKDGGRSRDKVREKDESDEDHLTDDCSVPSEDEAHDMTSNKNDASDEMESSCSFQRHVSHVLTNDQVTALLKQKNKYKWEMPAVDIPKSKWVGTGENMQGAPDDPFVDVKGKLRDHWQNTLSDNLNSRLRFFSLCNSYRDIMHCNKKPFYLKGSKVDSSTMDAYIMHALSHVHRTRDVVIKMTRSLGMMRTQIFWMTTCTVIRVLHVQRFFSYYLSKALHGV